MKHSEERKSKVVLIADDDAQILDTLEEFLKPFQHTHDFKVVTAQDGEAAIALIDSQPIDLLITDLHMPKADGFVLISHLINHSPSTPVVVITAYGSPSTRKRIHDMEIVNYVEKPIEFDRFIGTILDILSQERKGKIEGISITILLQLLEMEKTTCTLNVSSSNRSGSLYLKGGELVDAETGTTKGKAAALEILKWDDVHIDLKKSCDIKTPSINLPLTEILLESFRIKDEDKRRQKADAEKPETEPGEKRESISFFREEDFGLGLEAIESMVGAADGQVQKPDTPAHLSKEEKMDIPKLMKAIDTLKENLGGALIATDIFSSEDAQSIAGWNSNPAACAVFSQFTIMINKSLKEVGFPEIGRYYLLDLVDKRIVIIIPMGDFQWGMLIDGSKTPLGLILNLAIPKAINAFEEALAG